MNKKLYTLFAILIAFLTVNVVRAAGPYTKDFETPISKNKNAERHLQYKDGYLMLDYDNVHGKSILSYYKANGELITSKNFDYIYNPVVSGDDIYAYLEDYVNNNYVYYVIKLNANLEEVARIEQPEYEDEISYDAVSDVVRDLRDYAFNIFEPKIDQGKVISIDINGKVVVYSNDLKTKTTHSITRDELNKYFPEVKYGKQLNNLSTPVKEYNYIESKNGYVLAEIDEVNEVCIVDGMYDEDDFEIKAAPGHSYFDCVKQKITLFDNNLNAKWSKEFEAGNVPVDARFVNNYVAVVVQKIQMDENEGIPIFERGNKIVIYDMSGRQVQEITSPYGFIEIEPTTIGFLVKQDTCAFRMSRGGITDEGMGHNLFSNSPLYATLKETFIDDGNCYANHQAYSVELKIETKVTKGKGTITAVSSSKPGAPVTFVVKPEEGYVLGEVRVTDANGKTVIFKDYTFTMPTADVMIEAVFLPTNPETKDIAIMVIAIAGITAGGLFILNRKKLKEIS